MFGCFRALISINVCGLEMTNGITTQYQVIFIKQKLESLTKTYLFHTNNTRQASKSSRDKMTAIAVRGPRTADSSRSFLWEIDESSHSPSSLSSAEQLKA